MRVVAEGLFGLAFASPTREIGLFGRAVARLAKEEGSEAIIILGVFAWVSRAGKWCCESWRIRDR